MSIEIWKPIHGFEELYEVSNLGNVRSKDHSTLVCRYCNGIPKVFVKTHLGRDIKCSISNYISSDRDYDDLMNYVNGVKIQDDYPKFGPGFYLYIEESGGDSKDSYRLHFLDHYINLIRIDIDNWLHDLSEARSSIEDDLKNEVQS